MNLTSEELRAHLVRYGLPLQVEGVSPEPSDSLERACGYPFPEVDRELSANAAPTRGRFGPGADGATTVASLIEHRGSPSEVVDTAERAIVASVSGLCLR